MPKPRFHAKENSLLLSLDRPSLANLLITDFYIIICPISNHKKDKAFKIKPSYSGKGPGLSINVPTFFNTWFVYISSLLAPSNLIIS